MQTLSATRDTQESLQTKDFLVECTYARAPHKRALHRKCLTASDGSCVIVRYFFITWESATPLKTSKLARHQVLSGFFMRRISEQERRDCNPAAPARKASSKVMVPS